MELVGIDAKLYYDVLGVDGGTWTLATNVRDVTLNMDSGEADTSTRDSDWKTVAATLKVLELSFEMLYDTDDTAWQAFLAAYMARTTPFGFALMDQVIATVGAEGLQADFTILGFDTPQPLEESSKTTVRAKPCRSTTDPAWTVISA